MMAVVHWDGGSDGWGTNFLDAVNWVGDVLPGPADTAVIGATGTTASITLSGTATVAEIDSSRPLRIEGGTLSGARFVGTDGAQLIATGSGGRLSGVTLGADLDVSSGTIYVSGGLTLDHTTIRVGDRSGWSTGAVVFDYGTQALAGTGEIIFGANSYNSLYARGNYNPGAAPTDTFTIGSGITIHGNSGRVNDSWNAYYYPIRILNQGTIAADAATPYAADPGWEQSDAGWYAGSTSHAIDLTGVTNPLPESAYKNYRYTHSSWSAFNYRFDQLTSGATYRVRLHLVDYDYDSAGQQAMNIALNGVTVESNLDLYAAAGARYKAIVRDYDIAADSTGSLLASISSAKGYASLAGIEILDGSTRVASSDCGGATVGGITVEPAVFVNEGTLSATTGESLTLAGRWTNAGSIAVSGATLNLGGAFTTADVGSLDGSRGTVNLTGSLDNAAATLRLDDTTGSLRIAGGSISGGRLETAGAAKFVATTSYGRLAGVTLGTDLDVSSGTIYVSGGLTLDHATIRVGDRSGWSTGAVVFDYGTQALAGTGEIIFGANSYNSLYTRGNYNPGAAPTETFTIGSGITIHGNSGRVNDSWNAYYYPIRILNQGTIAADAATPYASDLGWEQPDAGWYTGSVAQAIDLTGVTNPLPESAYKNYRYTHSSWSPFNYRFDQLTPGATYRVRLHLVDYDYDSAGQQAMNVALNGVTVESNLDLYAAAGARYKAVVRDYDVAADSAGSLIASISSNNGYASLAAIEILEGTARVASVDCGAPGVGGITIESSLLVNEGTLSATTGESLTLAGRWTNAGSIAVSGATLNLGGAFTTADVGSLDGSRGIVNLTGSLDNAAATLRLDDTTGSLRIAGGSISGGRLETAGAATFIATWSGGSLSGVTLGTDLDVSSGSITVRNGLTLDGATVRIGDRNGWSSGYVYFDGSTQSLAGTGEIIFGASGNNGLYTRGVYNPGAAPTETFTIGSGITIHGNSGRVSAQETYYYPIRILNQGTIAADAATPYASDLGWENGSGGSSGTFGSAVDRSGVANALPEAVYKNYRYTYNSWGPISYRYDGLTPGASYAVRFHFVEDNYTSAGQRAMDIALNGSTVQSGLDIYAEAGARSKALVKEYSVTADASGSILAAITAIKDAALVCAIEVYSGSTRVASSDCGGPGVGGISIDSSLLVNAATLSATKGEYLTLAGRWTNAGSIAVSGATLNLGGAFTTADIGSLDGSRGTVNLTGSLDNSAATLRLDDTTGPLRIAGGSITGGRIETAGVPKLVATGSDGRLAGVTLGADLDVSSGSIHVSKGLSLDHATIRIGDRNGSSSGSVYLDGGTQTIDGTGAFVFGASSSNLILPVGSIYNWGATPTETLTFASGITIHGSAGRIGDNWYSNAYPIKVVSQGTIAADAATPYASDLGYDRFLGGSSWTESTGNAIDTAGVAAALPEQAYRTDRIGSSFSYAIPGLTAGATYRVRLHFAELYWNESGQRIMNVDLNGGRVLENLDVIATAGAKFKAVVREFDVAADQAGRIVAAFKAVSDYAIVSAIEIFSGATRVASIDCGTSAGTISVLPTDFATGGTLAARDGGTLSLAPQRSGATWSNAGTLAVDGGTMSLGGFAGTSGSVTVARGTLAVSGDYVQTDGSTTLVDGTLDPSGVASIAAGTLTGSGSVKSDLSSAGTMVIGRTGTAGTLSVEGTFTQAATGTLRLEIGGLPPKFSDSTAPAIAAETEPNDNGEPGFQPADLAGANDLSGSFVEISADRFQATVTGTISAGSDQDWDFFKVPLLAGDQLRIELRGSAFNGGTLSDTYLHLYDASGNRIASDDDALGGLSSLITVVVPASGDYFIVADSYSGNTGSYTLVTTVTRVGGVDSPNDLLRVTGAASLAGTLDVSMIGDYEVPKTGIPFDVVRYGSRSGAFDTVSGLDQGNGRSFTIDYRTDRVTLVSAVDDSAPPLLQSITPAGLLNRPVSSLRVVFNEPIDAATFTAADVKITTPSGVVDAASVTVTRINATDFDVVFPALDAEGAYTVEIGPDVTDTAGNAMTRSVTSSFTIDTTGPRVVSASPTGVVGSRLTAFEVTFDGPIDGATFAAADASLIVPSGATVAPSSVARVSDTVYRVTFPAQTRPGDYVLSVGPDIRDAAGNPLDQNADGTAGDPATDVFTVSATVQAVDLVVSGLAVSPASLQSGATVTVRWSDANQGSAATVGTWYDRVRVVNTTTGQTLVDTTLGISQSLAAGATLDREYAFHLPDGLPGTGDLEITVTVDSNAAIDESNADGTGETNNAATLVKYSALAPYPDLGVTGLAVAQTSLQSGGLLTVRWNDANTGSAAAAGGWYDRVRVVNTTTGATLADVSLHHPAALAAGASDAREYSFTLPDGPAGAGDLEITVTADSSASVFEYNADGTGETNNAATLAKTSALAAYPDLRVGDLVIDQVSLQSGGAVTVRWNDLNTGSSATSAGWYDRVRVVNTTTGATLVDVLVLSSRVLGAGGTLGREYAFTLPDGSAGAGDLEITVTADATGTLFEYAADGTGETNNAASITKTSSVAPYADLAVSGITAPASALPGETVTVRWTVTNGGTATASGPWSDRVFLSSDAAVGDDRWLASLSFDGTLAAGASATREMQVTIPAFVGGDVRFVVETGVGRSFYEPGTADNVAIAAAPTSVVAALQLALSRIRFAEGDGASAATATVSRNGDTSADLVVDLASSLPAGVGVPARVTIPAGQASVQFAVAAIDDAISQGSRAFSIAASSAGFVDAAIAGTLDDDDVARLSLSIAATNVAENAANPVATATVTRNTPTTSALVVKLQSDNPTRARVPATVTIPAGSTSATFPITVVDNTAIDGSSRVSFTATADGLAGAGSSVVVTDDDVVSLALLFRATTVTEGEGSPATIGTVTRALVTASPLTVTLLSSVPGAVSIPATVTIPANAASVSFTVNAPDDALATGARSVVVAAQPTTSSGVVLENGTASATLTVLDNDGPTLVVTASTVSVREGATIEGRVIRNTSTAADLVVTLSSSDTTEAVVPATVTIPAGSDSATFTIRGVADGVADRTQSASIVASAAGFNAGSFPVLVTDADLPDLRVTAVSGPTAAKAGQSATITWTVVNDGVVAATGSWIDRIYLSADDQLGDDVLVGSLTYTGSLAVGESTTRTQAFTLPANLGTYTLLAVTDGPAIATAGVITTGFVAEGSETNNLRASAPITLSAAYRATATVALDVSPQGAPVTITGRAFDPESGSAAAGVPVTVRIAVKGTRRLLNAVTGDDGTFTAVFQPLANEAGSYSVCADHPGVTADTAQDSFRIYGMRANYAYFNATVTGGSPVTGTLTISNLGDLPLTGVTVEPVDLPGNLTIDSSIASSIAAGASVPLSFTVTSTGAEPAESHPFLRVRSAEGAELSFPLNVTVLPFQPRLVASAGLLERGMLRGEQTLVSFDVTNLGGADAADVTFNLPDFDWMRVVSPLGSQSLAVGATMRVTLALAPAADAPLLAYDGSIGVAAGDGGVSVPFRFRAISDAIGDLTVSVQDENTFYVAGAPLLAGARVALLDPYDSSKVIAEATSGSDGRVSFTGVREGVYMLDVQAPKHGQYRQPVTLHAGVANEVNAFVPYQAITYSWSVTPTEIVDRYAISLSTTFETNVPKPVVTLEFPQVAPTLGVGDSMQIEAVLTNHGLIAAEDVEFTFTPPTGYVATGLVDTISILPAKSQIRVPIVITRTHATTEGYLANVPCSDDVVGLAMDIAYTYICGVPIGAMLGGFMIFYEAMGAITGPIEYIEGCLIDAVVGGGSGDRNTGSGPGERGKRVEVSFGGGGCRSGAMTSGLYSTPTTSASSDEGVCARVKLALDQQATLTRSAFNGVLTLNNGSTTGPLENVQVTLDFRDAAGNSVNDRFFVQPARLSGISAIDGTGTLAANSSGTARYTIIPTRTAAPAAPTVYSIGGTLRYVDPDSKQEVVVPLVGATITVYPDPNLQLDYFWQRDVYGDDPHTEEVEPSEPFAVGLIVTNTGHGTAKNFTVTSAQPKIVENEKGLLVDFSIIGTQVDVNPVAPSLTANFGSIGAGQSVVGQWLMTSTLQGKFIDFAASFTHADELGGKATSLIDTVNIHELIRSVRVGGDGDDGRPDFLVNDVADPDHLPDTLWLSNGSKAPVSVATDISVDRAMAGGRLVATVTAAPVSGWAYAAIPDAPAGYRLDSVTRSDGTLLAIGKTAWQTDRTFPASTSAAVRERLVHLLDRDATGTWTLSYVVDDRIAPVLLSIGDVDPNPRSAPVDSIDVTFSEAIDPTTFTAADLSLSRDGGANLVDGNVTITHVSGGTYRIGGLTALTTADGVYEVTVVGAGVKDWGGNAATGTVARRWATGAAGPYVVSLAAPSGSGAPIDTVEVTFSAAVDPATFSLADLSLARDGGANLVDDRVVIDAVSATTYRIHGLSGLTGDDGRYTLSVRAAGVTGGTGLAGVGSLGLDWIRDTLRPTVAAVQQPATNPRNIVVPSLDVTFSEPVDLASFTRDDLFITRDGVPVATDSRVTIQALSATTFRIAGFTWFVGQEGTYRFSVSAEGILDLAGNVGTGSAAAEWVMDTTAPSAPTSLRIEADTGASAADGVTTARTMTLRGMLGEPGLTVEIRDIDAGVDLGKATVTGTEFSKEITLAVEGRHRIRIRLVDAAGNVGREARDMKPGGYFDVVIDRTAPTLLSIETVATSPRTTPIDTIDVELSEEIDGSTLDWRDVVLTRDDGANLVTDAVTVERLSGNTWRVGNLDALTADDGEYRLTVVADGVADVAGNAGRGSVATAWITDGGGSLRRSSLTGNVFHDHAGDRKIDEGDEGLAGWTVFIDTDGNGVANGGEPSATTAADGSFRISGLAAGTHTVIAVAPNGWTQSLPAVVGHGQLADVVSGGITGQVDFGFYRAGRIEGTLFDDRNRSGARDPGEPGVAGWTVYLDLNADGQRGTDEPAVTTGGDGGYVFTDLAPGTYAVAQVYRDQWTQTSPGTDGGNVSGQQAAATLATGNLAAQSFVIFDQRCACVAGKPTTFATGAPVSADGSAMAWADADPSTPNVIDVWYDFRGQNGWTNTISTVQIELAEKGLQLWEGASGGAIHFIRNPFAPASDIINIGVGNLAALGGTSGPRNVLGLGGAVFAPLSQGGLRSGVAWLDFAENWDNTFGNGNVAGSFDFFTTVSHEIGHALGIEHATGAPADSLMHGIYGGERTTFAVADSMAVRELYAGCGVSIGGQGGWTVTPVVLPGTHVVTVFSGSVIYSQDFGNASDNAAPTSVSLANAITAIAENTSTVTRLKVADIVIADDTNGTNVITLSGADAASFEVDGTELFVRAGAVLNYEQKASYSVTVRVSDASVAGSTPVTVDYTLSLIDVDETPATPVVTLSRDTGSSDTDRVTSIGLLDITAVIPAAKIEYSVNSGTQWTDSFAAVEGANSVLVRQSDADGNTSRAAELAFTLDTNAPAAPSASLFNDTGFSTTDLVTKDGRAIILFPERDYRVEVRKVGTVDWALLAAGTSPGNAPVTLVSLLPALIQGRNDFVFRVTDLAGNISSDNLFGFAYDNVAPSAPVARLSADTGISATDRITTIGTLVAATPFETGAKVEYRQTYPTTQRWTSAFVPSSGPNAVEIRQTDRAGNVSETSLFSFTLDSSAATITGITLPTAGNYSAGQILTFSVTFSETVYVKPYNGPAALRVNITPYIELTIGGVKRRASYQSGSGTNTLVFSYKIQNGDKETGANGIGIASLLSLNAGNWIADAAGNNSSLSFASKLPTTLPRIRIP